MPSNRQLVVGAGSSLASGPFAGSRTDRRIVVKEVEEELLSYRTGFTKNPRNSREIRPPTMTIANGFCESLPMPVDIAAGSRPMQATSAVIMIGRSRSSDASCVARHDVLAFQPQLVDERVEDDARLDRDAHQRDEAEPRRHAEVRAGELERQQAADRHRHEHAEHDDQRELQVAVEREQDQEDQQDGQRR